MSTTPIVDAAQARAELMDQAGLVYATDEEPGLTRRKSGNGFAFYDARGKHVTDEKTIERAAKLAVPPAYTDVWISPDPAGHLQATGRDERGRKQYVYHPRWTALRGATKYELLESFAEALTELRARVAADLKLAGLPRAKVLAACVELLDRAALRVGNDRYAKENGSFGVTTLRDRHLKADAGGAVRLDFVGKHGIRRRLNLKHARLAKILRACQELPGQRLFQYVDADTGARVDVGSRDVNEYLHELAGPDVTAKTFRTWHGTVSAAVALRALPPAETKAQLRKSVNLGLDAAADLLGNTRTVCRQCYVHPAVPIAYEQGTIGKLMSGPKACGGLTPDECATLRVIQKTAWAREVETG